MLTIRSSLLRAVVVAVCLATAAVVTVAPASAAPPSAPYISEIHYDNAGTDVGEFVEVHVPAGASTAGWSVVLYNGNGGAAYGTQLLPAVTVPPGGPPAAVVVSYSTNGVQNGSPDGVALIDSAGTVVELLSYEGTLTATSGPAAGMTSVDIGVAEAGTELTGQSLSRAYDVATDQFVWRGPALATMGTPNPTIDDQPTQPCRTVPSHEIGAVQGSGFSTPLDGQQVSVRGVVVGDTGSLGGFYLQDADGDGDLTTSDGIFVASSTDVALGDIVQASGVARESFGETQIGSAVVEICDTSGNQSTLPDARPLDLPSGDVARELLEGMLVTPVDVLTVSEIFDLTRFGELTLSEGGLLVQPPSWPDRGPRPKRSRPRTSAA